MSRVEVGSSTAITSAVVTRRRIESGAAPA